MNIQEQLFQKLLGKEKSLDDVLNNSAVRLQALKYKPKNKFKVTGSDGATSIKLYDLKKRG